MVRARTKALLALWGAVLAISFSAIFVRWAHMPGVASAFYRVLIASAALWLLTLARRSSPPRFELRTVLLAGAGGVFFAADVGCYNVAVLRTGAGSATFLGNNAPLAVGLLTWFLTRRPPHRRFWIALVVALAGAYLIVSLDLRQFRNASSGDLLAVLASVCFALYLVVTERLRGTMDALTLVALSTSASALALFVATMCAHISLHVPSLPALGSIVGLGLVCQLCGYLCLTYALGHTPATISSVILLAVAPFTALLAFVLFHERMTWPQWIGGALILVAIWIVNSEPATKHGSVLPTDCPNV